MTLRWEESDSTRGRGAAAESFAASWLAGKGYRVLATNVTTRAGEIDIVAVDGETLVFVEVKARVRRDFGPAIAAVGLDKQRRVARAASAWLATNTWSGACRFDVVGLDRGVDGWDVTHLPDAFDAPGSR